MSTRRANAIVWQEAPFSEAALRRIENDAELHVKATHRRTVRAALQRLANVSIHRAFDHPMAVKKIERVRIWSNRVSDTDSARKNRDQSIADARSLGPFALPPADYCEGKPLADLLDFYDPAPSGEDAQGHLRKRGRRARPFDDKLTHHLCVCFWLLFGVKPDCSRGSADVEIGDNSGRVQRRGSTGRFIRAFYQEVGIAIQKAKIDDPEGRGRACSWRVPKVEMIAKRLRPIIQRAGWRDWRVTQDGAILSTGGHHTPAAAKSDGEPAARKPWMRPRLSDVLGRVPPDERERHLAALRDLPDEDARNSYIDALPRPLLK